MRQYKRTILSWVAVFAPYLDAQATQQPYISDIAHTVMGPALKETADLIPAGKFRPVLETIAIIGGNLEFQWAKSQGFYDLIPGITRDFYWYKVFVGWAGGAIAMVYDRKK